MDGGYRVIMTGKVAQGRSPAEVAEALARLTGKPLEYCLGRLRGTVSQVRQGLELAEAQRLQQTLEGLGVCCRLEAETLSLEPIAIPDAVAITQTCPKCGHSTTDPRSPLVTTGSCPQCGVIVAKYRPTSSVAPAKPSTSSAQVKYESSPGAGIGSVVPLSFFKSTKFILMAIGLVLMLVTGVSIFERPTYEIIYKPELAVLCPSAQGMEAWAREASRIDPALAERCAAQGKCAGCVAKYQLELLNTGLRPQPQTVVRLKLPDKVDYEHFSQLPVFLDFGNAPRNVQVRQREGVVSYALGPLRPTDNVVLKFSRYVKPNQAAAWPEVLQEVAVARGEAVAGEPKLTLLSRILFSVFNWNLKSYLETAGDVFLDGVIGKDKVDFSPEFGQGEADLALSLKFSGSSALTRPGDSEVATLRPRCGRGQGASGCSEAFWLDLTVANRGPSDAREVVVKLEAPSGIRVHQTYLDRQDLGHTGDAMTPENTGAGQWSKHVKAAAEGMQAALEDRRAEQMLGQQSTAAGFCRQEGRKFVCPIGDLSPGAKAVLHQRLSLGATGSYLFKTEVGSAGSDPVERNDRARLTIEVENETTWRRN